MLIKSIEKGARKLIEWNNEYVRKPRQVSIYRLTLAVYLLTLAFVVWSPVSDESGKLLELFLIEGKLERLLNLLLLSPLPFLLIHSLIPISIPTVLAIGPVVSITIETIQNFIPGRVMDLIDITLNSLGYLIVAIILNRKVLIKDDLEL